MLVGTSCVQMSNACPGENKPYASGNTLCRWEQAVCRCQKLCTGENKLFADKNKLCASECK